MNSIYYFENSFGCNPAIKTTCQKHNIEIDYETKLYNLLSKIITVKPSFIIVNQQNAGFYEEFYDCFCEESPFYVPLVFVLTDSEIVLEKLSKHINCMVVSYKTFFDNFAGFYNTIKRVESFKSKVDNFCFTKFNQILSFLFKLNFSVKNQGTIYLKDCIKQCITCGENFDVNLGDLYTKVAFINQTTASAVERAIRIAIKTAWKDLDVNMCAQKLGVDPVFFEKQPSCREFIIFSTEFLINQSKEQCFNKVFPILKARYV